MSKKSTIKGLEELVKTEHMAIAALDAALDETEDNKLRKNYRKWRDSHVKQAQALNDRLEELGGTPVEYEIGSGKGQATLWGKLTGTMDTTSIAGMRIGAERGIKRYIDHLDEIDDPQSLSIIRKNLEAKQDEIEWYDSQANRERAQMLDTRLDTAKVRAVDEEITTTNGKGGKKGGLPFPLLVVLGAVGAAAYFLMRRSSDESDYEDYGEDAFRYEGEDTTTSQSGYTSSGSYSSASAGNGATASDYSTGMAGDVSTPS